MEKRFNFTKETLNGLPLPAAGCRDTYHDKKTPGLQLRVTSSGVKTFCVFRRIKGGQPERITLGRFSDSEMTIEQARKQAAKINAAIADGANPAEAKRAHKEEPTFAEFFSDYIERHAKPNKRTWGDDQQRYEQYLAKPLGKKKFSAVLQKDIAAIHSAITMSGHPAVANRVLALVSSVYGRAIEWGLVTPDRNPAKGIKRNREQSRDRFLQTDELPRFFQALADEENETFRDYFLISLLTGARRSNVLAMRWSEISFDRAEWRIPTTKNGTPQTITLTEEALEILQARKPDEKERAVYVFPAESKSGHVEDPKTGWKRILDRDELSQLAERIERAGGEFSWPLACEKPQGHKGPNVETLAKALERARKVAKQMELDTTGARLNDLRIHDLRRTLGSWQAKTGASLAIIGKSLNHKSQQTTAIYARLDLDPVRESLERATSAMLNAAGLKPSADVVEMKKAQR